MDAFQTVAGAETPADVTAAELEQQDGEVQAVDQGTTVQMEEQPAESEAAEVEELLAEEPPSAEPEATEPSAEPAEEVEEPLAEEPPAAGPAAAEPSAEPAEEGEAAPAAQSEATEPSEQPVKAEAAEMGGMPMEDWDYRRPRRGEVRSGVILSIRDQEIIVDVGGKRDGIVPYADLQRLSDEERAALSVGDEVLVYVLRPEDQDGNLLLSLNMARQEQSWRRAQELADSGEVWEGEVVGYNKGGLVVPLDDIRGFVPASQVPGFPQGLSQEERLQRLSEMVGQTLQVKVIEINRRKRRLILSATTALRQWRKQQRERLLNELREGEVRRGTVSSICSFGAFVDLGGADGLIHLSELSWRRVRHPREVLDVGQEVDVYVLRLDHEKRRIGLSLKRLEPEPWALVEDKYELGQLVEGTVTNVVDFGAFAEIEDGVEGLIHVSELADAPVSHPREVVKKGDLLLLRIIRIDPRRKRLGLSLKRVLEAEWAEWAAQLAERTAQEEAEAQAKAAEELEQATAEALEPVETPAEEEPAAAAEEATEAAVPEPAPEGEEGGEPIAVVEEATEAVALEPAPEGEPEGEEEEEATTGVVKEIADDVTAPQPAPELELEEEEEEPVAVVVEETAEATSPEEEKQPVAVLVEEVLAAGPAEEPSQDLGVAEDEPLEPKQNPDEEADSLSVEA